MEKHFIVSTFSLDKKIIEGKYHLISSMVVLKPILEEVTFNKYKDLSIVSTATPLGRSLKNFNLNLLLKNLSSKVTAVNSHNRKKMIKDIYTSIRYKNIGGIRIEVKGRLTPRYRADRSVYSLRW